ncbi:MAG TPA: FAD:protein FMN transferase [Acidimicrobiales bacterium]|nr:FAD:protein FMN transferase [Acidimicrobiales bacterium]
MGTEAHVIAVGDKERLEDVLRQATRRVEELEAKWSRFRPTSELSRLNAAAGRPVIVSPETFEAVARAVHAWYVTGGRFDPTVHRALIEAGYDRTFRDVPSDSSARDHGPVPVPGCGEIGLSRSVNAVTLPPGVTLDLGGIGKGYAADLIVRDMLRWGATGASVSLGGDVRVRGESPFGPAWVVIVENPLQPGDELDRLVLGDGAVVTSTRLMRTWKRNGAEQHHIIDPTSGCPAWTGVAAVTVVASEASWAEVLAKAAFLAGVEEGLALLRTAGLTGFVIEDGGRVHRVAGLEVFSSCSQ